MLKVAREVAARYALPNAVYYWPQDALRSEIPGTYDLVLISNTLHMLGERQSRTLLRRVHDHVAPGGSLVVQAQYLRADRRGWSARAQRNGPGVLEPPGPSSSAPPA